MYVTHVFCHKELRCCVAVYLCLSSGRFISASSHICGSWHLPIFLFRDWSLTLMIMGSLMYLAVLWSSLHTILILSIDMS